MVDVKAVKPFVTPVTLEAIKREPKLAKMVLVTNSRLSVQPVSKAHGRSSPKWVGSEAGYALAKGAAILGVGSGGAKQPFYTRRAHTFQIGGKRLIVLVLGATDTINTSSPSPQGLHLHQQKTSSPLQRLQTA